MGVKMITNDDNCTFELLKEKKETKKISLCQKHFDKLAQTAF